MTYRNVLVLLAVFAVLPSCAGRSLPHGYDSPGAVDVVVANLTFDDKGLPVLPPPLTVRPSGTGERFTIARVVQNRPTITCDIVAARRPDFLRPFEVIYEWTGRGFQWGLEGTAVLGNGFYFRQQAYSGEEALISLAIIATPLAAGTVGGFVVGIVDGLRQTVTELGKAVQPGEQVITCTTYEYDPRGRLQLMRMLSPDGKQELVRTSFFYEGSSTVPVRTIVKSRIEGKDRDIR